MMPELPEEQDQQMQTVQPPDTRVLRKVYCSVCHLLPTSDLYHCKMQHITCSKCVPGPSVEASEKEKKIRCVKCGNLMVACKIGNFLLSRLLLDCVNKANGCLVSVGLSHQHECLHSDYFCSVCEVQGFMSDISLKEHIDERHHQGRIQISIGTEAELRIEDTKVILEDSNHLFLLSFERGNLSLHHVLGDEPPRKYLLSVMSDLDTDYRWEFCGYTTKMSRFPVEALKLPSLFDELFAANKPAFCEVEICEKTNPEANPITIRFDGLSLNDLEEYLKCMICSRIVKHPVYHCLVGHLTCGECLGKDKINPQENAGKCLYCSLEMMKCDVGAHILTHSHFSCFEKECGCGSHVAYDDLEVHARICNRPFFCPVCLTTFSELDLLTEHFTTHRENILRINPYTENKLTVKEGVTLLEQGLGSNYDILIFERGRLCVQHLPHGTVRSYTLYFKNKGRTWKFQGQTEKVEKRPTVSDKCFVLPSRTDPSFPVEVTMYISRRV